MANRSFDTFHSSDLWSAMKRAAKLAQKKRIAVAYFSEDFFSLRFGDTLITDASDGAIGSGQTNAKTLSKLFNAGVKLYSCPGLHAKVAVFDASVFISSANLSLNSEAGRLFEAGVSSTRSSIRFAALTFMDALIRKRTTVRMDEAFIDHICKIEVKRVWHGGLRRRRTFATARVNQERFWLLTTILSMTRPGKKNKRT